MAPGKDMKDKFTNGKNTKDMTTKRTWGAHSKRGRGCEAFSSKSIMVYIIVIRSKIICF